MKRRQIYINLILLVLFALAFAFSISKALGDPDTFWHLATGKWIWQHKALPTEDPFSFTTQTYAYEYYTRVRFILRQYWLSQILMYFFYLAGGYWGIILLRYLIYFSIVVVLFAFLKKQSLEEKLCLFFLVPVAYVLSRFIGDRPNQITYLMATVFMVLLIYKRENKKIGYLIVPLMCLWSNLHGGFLLGVALLCIVLFYDTLVYIFSKSKQKPIPEGTVSNILTALAGIVAGGLNPNVYDSISTVLETQGSLYASTITESKSPIFYMVNEGSFFYVGVLIVCILVGLITAVVGFKYKKKEIPFYGLVFIFLIALGFQKVRYVVFAPVLMVPAVVMITRDGLKRIPMGLRSFIVTLMIIGFIFNAYTRLPYSFLKGSLIEPRYPEAAVKFIKSHNLKGELFNSYMIGGYLIWRLYPDMKVFIDGRGLVPKAYNAWFAVITGQQYPIAGKPAWKAILDTYGIKYILITPIGARGAGVPLVKRLYEDMQWKLNFVDGRSGVMFWSRGTDLPEVAPIMGYTVMLTQALNAIRAIPHSPVPYITAASADLLLGRPHEALKILQLGLNRVAPWKRKELNKYIEKIKNEYNIQ